jgi:hypothetical protein
MQAVGLVWDLQMPPQKVLDGKLEEGRPRAIRVAPGAVVTPSPAPLAPVSVPTIEAAAE